MHEIITLQLGGRSNYLATHFWNEQEAQFTYVEGEESLVDHDVHFRSGVGADGSETFLPRTVIYDLKGGFGSMRQINALYELEADQDSRQGLWDGPSSTLPLAPIEPHPYQQSLNDGLDPPSISDESVRFWSDYNRVFYHPRSIVQINEYENNSALMPFESWNVGCDLFESLDKENDLLDRDFRPFAEESDSLQGIQIMSSVDDAWGGFTARYLDRLRDEYGKTSIWQFGIADTQREQQTRQIAKLKNIARSFCDSSTASIFVPMEQHPQRSPEYFDLNPSSAWRTAGLHAAALSTVTLPSRLKGAAKESRNTTETMINLNGNQSIVKLSLGAEPQANGVTTPNLAPNGISGDEIHSDGSDGNLAWERMETSNSQEEISLFPWIDGLVRQRGRPRSAHTFAYFQVIRSRDEVSSSNSTLEDPENHRRRRAAGTPLVHKVQSKLGYPLLNSFPPIFGRTGNEAMLGRLHGSLETSSSIKSSLLQLQGAVGRSSRSDIDEREELSNRLGEMAESYTEGWESDDGSEDDD